VVVEQVMLVCYKFVVDFDRFSVVLHVLRTDAPDLSEADADELQDAHMSYLSDLQDAGHLLAAGPLLDEHFRGLTILGVSAEVARHLLAQDPAVKAGRFEVVAMPWLVPGGVMRFGPGRLPRSTSDLE
jgi:hypothetical protein